MNVLMKETIGNLEKNNIRGYYVTGREELLDLLNDLIPQNSSVGCGDSVTMEQLQVFDYLRQRGDLIFNDKHQKGLTREQKREIYLDNFRADVFVSGMNAVTMNGEIINIDGNGSRVAPIIYGPQKVILIGGTNKIAADADAGWERARQTAAPLDAKRLNKAAPCVSTGTCMDCRSRDRICNAFVMIARQLEADRIHVILVEGNYGY
jgi:hypothetical protein